MIESIILGIVAGVVGNLLTPPLKNWVQGIWHINTKKGIEQIKSELAYITELEQNRRKLHLLSIFATFEVMSYISLSLFFIYSSSTVPFAGAANFISRLFYSLLLLPAIIFSVFAARTALGYFFLVSKIANFEKYKRSVEQRIEKLRARVS